MNNIKNISSVCRNIPLLLIQINAFTFLLAFSTLGKTQRCTNYTVQLTKGAKFSFLLGTKFFQYRNGFMEKFLLYWKNSCPKLLIFWNIL